jgi:hypothetical protein
VLSSGAALIGLEHAESAGPTRKPATRRAAPSVSSRHVERWSSTTTPTTVTQRSCRFCLVQMDRGRIAIAVLITGLLLTVIVWVLGIVVVVLLLT